MSNLVQAKILSCNDPYLPQFVKDKIVELQGANKICQQITMMPGNVFEIKTATLCPPFERFVIQPEASGGNKTRKRNRKDKRKKKHIRKTNKNKKPKK